MKTTRRLALLGLLILAASVVRAEKTSEQKPSEATLKEQIRGGDMNTKARAAEILWEEFPGSKKAVEDAMENEKNPEARRRIAQVIAAKHKHPRAIAILRESMRQPDFNTHAGALAFLLSAMAIKQATGELSGTKEIIGFVASPAKFSELEGSSFPYAKRDGLRVMAASFLIDHLGPSDRDSLHEALTAYSQDLENNIKSSSGRERRYWEGRLTTTMEMALRANMPDLPLRFENKKDLLKEKYERERLERALKRAREKKP
jgi:hypothetical protein